MVQALGKVLKECSRRVTANGNRVVNGGAGEENKGLNGSSRAAPLDVLYTAPTGKAASVIARRAQTKAYTIHQIWAADKCRDPEKFKPFADVQILVVDETSMVSLEVRIKNVL